MAQKLEVPVQMFRADSLHTEEEEKLWRMNTFETKLKLKDVSHWKNVPLTNDEMS